MAGTADAAVCGVANDADDAASTGDELECACPSAGGKAATATDGKADPDAAPASLVSDAASGDGVTVVSGSTASVAAVMPPLKPGPADGTDGVATSSPPDAAVGFGPLRPADAITLSAGTVGQISPPGTAAMSVGLPSLPADVRVADGRTDVVADPFAPDAGGLAIPELGAEPSSPGRSASGVAVATAFGSRPLDATARAESGGIVCVP